MTVDSPAVTVIQPHPGWRLIDFREVWAYRDLFYFLVWRDIKARYAQTILGFGWAIIQPVFTMIVFTIVFGNLAKISSDGQPYALFTFAAIVPWTFFSTALTDASTSLIGAANTLNKVYFPRIIIPLTPILGKLVDFGVAMILLFCLMAWYRTTPTAWIAVLPLLVVLMAMTAAGMGMWLTALAIQYRDVKYAMAFFIQILMYAAPVVYPTTLIPTPYRPFYALNPMVGVIEGFRSALLNTNPMPWDLLAVGTISALVIFTAGGLYFRRTERIFADVA